MPDVAVWILLVIAGSVVLGALVQSVVGLGLGLVAAPVVTLLAPELMPGSLLLLGMTLPLLTLARERRDVDWGGFGWAMPGRVLGTVAGAWVVATVSARDLGVAVGLVVLLAVALTARAVTVPITRTSLGVAGFVSGVAATTSAIGGPPMALLYQHRPARQVRSTLAVYFVVGSALSLVTLAVAGELPLEQLALGALMVPLLFLGAAVGERLRPHLPAARFRALVLAVSAVSAVVLVVRSLL